MLKFNALPPVELVRDLFNYDEATGIVTWKKCLNNKRPTGSVAGYLTKFGYYQVSIKNRKYMLHRIIWLCVTGEDPAHRDIDHIDGNRSNNRLENLRLASRSENNTNRGAQRNNLLGYKGVHWSEKRGKYRAKISINGERVELGFFDTPELAHMAYCKAAAELHGEFARGA